MSYMLSKRSLEKLDGIHDHLVIVVKRAILITEVDFSVVDGVRTLEQQKRYLKIGATTTLNSRHLTGHAVDLVPYVDGELSWHWPLCHKVNEAMQSAADSAQVEIEWGGYWRNFPDGAHFQLPWAAYPIVDTESTG